MISRLRVLANQESITIANEAYPELAPFLAAVVGSIYQVAFFTTQLPAGYHMLPQALAGAAARVGEADSELELLSLAAAVIGAAVSDSYLEACVTGAIDAPPVVGWEDIHVAE
ncbi:MAG: hypothetical protein KDE59_30955 [Anaerolineales bacterium]|nr:hypothetical protein [Anaerolineales bacterium]